MRVSHAASYAGMEPAFQMVMTPQRLSPMLWSAQHAARLVRQSTYGGVGRDVPSTRRLVSNCAHRTAGDPRHNAKQMSRLGMAMKYLRHLPYAVRQPRCGPGQHSGDLGQSPLRHGCDSLRHYWKKLAGSHSDKGEKMFRGLVLALGFCRQLAEVLHDGVWIDFADGADLILAFVFALDFVLAFPENASEKVFPLAFPFAEDVSEKVFTFSQYAPKEVFVFSLVFEFGFELVFQFGFQLTLISHN